ncbi:MAG TPA: two-component regulator propeller domain-containing protein, partial [Luteimonas sp.]|nr:two-component regulator propeller domain-containing protein [Luteimonas sp.]
MLACLLLACAPAARALKPDKAFANYVLNTWSIQDGLPQISALCLAQDRTGYVWVGTQSGLARFDGVRFVSYTPEDTPALAGIWIRSLLADREGRLWIGTYQRS